MALPIQKTDREYKKFTEDGEGNVAVNTVSASSKDLADRQSAEILEASDLSKVFAYTAINGSNFIATITHTSAKMDALYGATLTLTRTLSYTGEDIASVVNDLTVI